MKTIYLFRHSTPVKNSALPNAEIPLSAKGAEQAKQIPTLVLLDPSVPVISSPYLRAQETASYLGETVFLDDRLVERRIGDRESFTKELWTRQYSDPDAGNEQVESFRSVRNRMTECIQDILHHMKAGESVAVVSHAAAICAFLQQYCTVQVTDADTKKRRIVFQQKVILDGKMGTPSCFKCEFEDTLRTISYMDFSL